MTDKKPKKNKNRYSAIFILISIIFAALCIRVFWIEIVNGDFYKKKLAFAVSESKVETPTRGLINDRNGKILAENLPVSNIVADPQYLKENKVDIEKLSDKLAEVLGSDREEIKKGLTLLTTYSVVQKDMKSDKAIKINDWIKESKLDGISTENGTSLIANPKKLQENKADIEYISEKLSGILGSKKDDISKKLALRSQYSPLEKKVDLEKVDVLKKWLKESKINGLIFEEDTRRYYPNKNLASQVIGFTGDQNQGLYGIELQFEQYLKGIPGKRMFQKDAKQNPLPFGNEDNIYKQDGLNVNLTIDQNIQAVAEKALQKTIEKYKVLNGASLIAVDPRNGQIIAMVSKPDFNLNDPFAMPQNIKGLNTDKWKSLSKDEKNNIYGAVFRNNAVNITYEPGSTFKTITAAMGFEEGIISPGTMVSDEPILVSGWPISCEKVPNHGRETFDQAIWNSCNPVFANLSKDIGIDRFYKYVNAFGFNSKTRIDLPGEESGQIQAKPRLIDMVTSSFGQNLQITPIQLAMAYSSIANGGKLLKPQIVKDLTDSNGNVVKRYETEYVRNVISKQTTDTLKQSLKNVVLRGTGTNAYISGYEVAGKTGTAETFDKNGQRSKERYISSFAGFAPLDNPVIVVLVVCDYPTGESHFGGFVAAPVVKEVMEEYLNYMKIDKTITVNPSDPQQKPDSNAITID